MFWLQLFGPKADGGVGVENIKFSFTTIESAISEARALASIETFEWGKATGYKIFDEAKRVVAEGKFET